MTKFTFTAAHMAALLSEPERKVLTSSGGEPFMLSFETDTYTHLVTLGLLIIEKPSMMASMTPLGVLVRDRLLMGSIQAPRTLAAGNGLKDATRTFTLAELDTMQLFASASSPVLFAMVEGSAVDMEFLRRARQDVIDLGAGVRRLAVELFHVKDAHLSSCQGRTRLEGELKKAKEHAAHFDGIILQREDELMKYRNRVRDLEGLLQQLAALSGSTLERIEVAE